MGVPNDRVPTLLEADVTERREAAAALVETATENPGALTSVVDRVVSALDDPDDRVRTGVARICFEVGTHDPTAVEPLLSDLLGALDDPVASVRANVARPVAEVIVRDPAAHRDAATVLRGHLDDRSESVRHSAAWALEWLAMHHPTVVPADRLTSLLGDGHPPVRKHAARLCALLPHEDETRHERLVELLSDEAIPVRRAACLALGGVGRIGGHAEVRSALGQAARTDLNETVRLAARRALREAVYEATAPVLDPARDTSALAAVLVTGERALGGWLRVDDPEVTVRGGRFRGTVEAVDSLQGTVALRNDPVGYRLELRRDTDGWRGTYEDAERTGTLDVTPTTARELDAERTPLRYAVEADRLEFAVEGTPHSIEVTDRDPETGRLRGENWMQGYVVEFRPEAAGPVRALFERGRSFEVTDLALRTAGDEADEAAPPE
ncbi:MAG: HEAT repeat domain-containing protein [Haloglomus sp.]